MIHLRLRYGVLLFCLALTACTIQLPEPPEVDLPTQPAVLEITPAPTLDIDATATVMAGQLRPTATPTGIYIVAAGDTLSEIAAEFDTTIEEILVANEMSDPNDLQVGQELIIPSLLPTPLIGTPEAEQLTATSTTTDTNEPDEPTESDEPAESPEQ